ncbi:MAG: YeeE/YedE family protein [Dehalococcoidia bacterium]|nr:YeeE/YedE family protein [Dehalococcoidia bacterium]
MATELAARISALSPVRWPSQSIAGAAVLLLAVGFSQVIGATAAVLAPLWLLGMLAGFALQRSRFCFASAFRDLFLFGQSRILNGILMGLLITTLGFALIMYQQVPFPQFGALPAEAHILPVGLSTVIGGVLFGVGMVLAGGCSSGSLYRVGEGYVASGVAVLGMVLGLGLLAYQWNWWWETLVRHEPKIWLAEALPGGYGAAVALTLAGLLAVFIAGLWWETRNGLFMPSVSKEAGDAPDGLGARLAALWRRVFAEGWSPVVGGAVLGVTGLLMYLAYQPFGVTGELSRWAQHATTSLNVGPGVLRGLDSIGGCAARSDEGGVFTATFAITVGLVVGALVAALFAGEFKLRFPRQRRRYAQALLGGLAMGYASGLAIGCTIGAFFSAIPSLAVSGWVFGGSLAGGAWLGVKILQRIP